MQLAYAPLVLILVGLVAYTILAGADFGTGVWELTARRGPRALALRDFAHDAMGPVWEANHVWLVFVLVVCWSTYPTAFGSIFSTLSVRSLSPWWASSCAVRRTPAGGRVDPPGARADRRPVRVVVDPDAVRPGAAVGGIASGHVPVGNAAGSLVTSWLNPTSIMIGAIAVAAAAHLAAVYLAADATRVGAAELVRGFRVRALLSGVATGALALAGLAVVRGDAEHLFEGLTHGAGLAAVLVSGAAGVATLVLVWAGRFEPARYAGALSVAAVVAGWALAQRPDFLPGLTVDEAAAGRATLITVLVVVGIGAVVLIPSLALLFSLLLHGRFDLSTVPETTVERHESSPPTPTLGVILVGLLVVGAVLAVFWASWGLALGIALLLVFVLGGFVVLASAIATGESDDLGPCLGRSQRSRQGRSPSCGRREPRSLLKLADPDRLVVHAGAEKSAQSMACGRALCSEPGPQASRQASAQAAAWRVRPSASSRRRLTAATRSDHHRSLRSMPR
jgi:cytochrome bd-type quinol oxidase subunit 2